MPDKQKKESEALKKVENLLKDPTLSIIYSRYSEDEELRDKTVKDIIIVSLLDDIYGKGFRVYADAETLELLYVQGPYRSVEIEDFFEL